MACTNQQPFFSKAEPAVFRAAVAARSPSLEEPWRTQLGQTRGTPAGGSVVDHDRKALPDGRADLDAHAPLIRR
jgi:hypothetical protein